MTSVPPPTAVMTRESFRESMMVLMNAMRKKRQDMGIKRGQRPSNFANWPWIDLAAATAACAGLRLGRAWGVMALQWCVPPCLELLELLLDDR